MTITRDKLPSDTCVVICIPELFHRNMITVFFVCLLLLYEQVKCSSPLSERINLSGPVLEVKGNKKQTTILLWFW